VRFTFEEITMKANAVFSAFIISRRVSKRHWLSHILLLYFFALTLFANSAKAQNTVVLVGSGSSVPAPLYNRWAQEYGNRKSNIQMRYLTVGTSEGIKTISHGAGDFAAGEAQLTEKERKEGSLIELPVVLIGIVPIYNVPDIHQELRLSGEVFAEILLGDVKMWNAPQIAKLNPEINLPNLSIQVINRPGGKGSNYVLTDFLSKVSPKFRAQIGITASPKWPVGEPAERSSDMADKVKSTPGSIGYVEYQYAVKGNIPHAAVLSPSGKFVRASTDTIATACQATESPRWNNFSASLTNAPGTDSYPITSFTWIYLRTQSSDSARSTALSDLLDWIYTDGQRYATQEGYAELPAPLLAAVRKKAKELR
jgi:phosphate transport system substrate-binding protein